MRIIHAAAILIPVLGILMLACTPIGPSGAGTRPAEPVGLGQPIRPRPPPIGPPGSSGPTVPGQGAPMGQPMGSPPYPGPGLMPGQGSMPRQAPMAGQGSMPMNQVAGPNASRGLNVLGEGTIMVDPDLAYVSSGVQSRGATAAEAQSANTTSMNAVIARIRALGIPERDIRTTGINLSPTYNRDGSGITGYTATNSVRITVREIRRAGEILDAVIREGANTVGGIQFSLADDTAARKRAVEDAVKEAQARASAIAAAANVRIVGIIEISDEGGGGFSPVAAPRAALMAESGPVPVQPGQLTITARVRVVFDIR